MVRTHACAARQVHSRNGKITSVLLPQSLADADSGDLLHQQESKIPRRKPSGSGLSLHKSEGNQPAAASQGLWFICA